MRRLSHERHLHVSDTDLRRHQDVRGMHRRSPVLRQKFGPDRVPS
jgi:hypothetical protein